MSEPIRVEFPWHKTLAMSGNGCDFYRWKPGVRFEDSWHEGDRDAVADGIGAMLLVEIGRYTPPGFRERVFYTRQFALPDGTPVGTPKLRVIGAAGFTRMCRGYRYPFDVVDTRADVAMEPEYADAVSF